MTMKPPRLALWLHERSLPADEREAVVGDLLEGFEARAAHDPRAARRWVWSQTWRSIAHNVYRRTLVDRGIPEPDAPHGGRIVNGIATDIRFAIRLLKRQPTSSFVAVASLTAALGLNVLLVTLADAVLFRPLPLRSPDDLVLVLLQRDNGLNHNFSYPDYADMRDRVKGLEALTAYSMASAAIEGGAGPAQTVDGEAVSGNFFSAVGVPLRSGRALAESDDRRAAPRAIVISERLWRERLASAPPSGQVLSLNGEPYAVVGVADGRFNGMQIGQRASFWVPLAHAAPLVGGDYLGRRTTQWLTLLGRLREGVARGAARDELDAAWAAVRAGDSRIEPVVLQSGARGDSMLSVQLASPLTLLLLAGGAVLLVACLNVANLQLARTDDRQHELAVRAALGARRTQLMRLLAIDGVLLTFVAGVLGLTLAAWLKDVAVSLIAFYGQPVKLDVSIDLRTIAAAAVVSMVAAAALAVLAALPLSLRGAPSPGTPRAASRTRPAAQRALVVLQVALSMALVTGAALLVRTVDRLRHAELGFNPQGVAVLQLSPEMGRMPRDRAPAYFDEVVRAVSALPGVAGAGVSHVMPLDFGGSRTSVDVSGYKPEPNEEMELNFTRVTPGYFAAMRMPILQGRSFDERDGEGQPERIIVNETMARRYWPEGRAVGGLLRTDSRQPFAMEVIGVVPDVHYRMVREVPVPSFYVPMAQLPSNNGVLHVRFAGGGAQSAAVSRLDELRRVVSAVNPAVPIARAHTLVDQVERNIADERMATAIGVTLAVVALLLAAAGLYATMAFIVGRRTREMGVRMALGARAGEVRSLVLREGVVLTAIGVAGGTALAAVAGRTIESLLYGVGRTDVVSLAAAAGMLTAAAVLACWIPARRASRVDPIVALRED
jgi:putative ABC transport system permease protein